MSYWKVASFAQPSPIEVRAAPLSPVPPCLALLSPLTRASCLRPPPSTIDPPPQQILSKESFTLEELLDEDDIIQECKSLNERLLRL